MPISGAIPITGGQGIIPPSSAFLIGVDLQRYVVVGQQGTASPQIKVGCAETNSTVFTKTRDQVATDFATLGLQASDGVPNPVGGGIAQGPIPIPGTPYFYVTGQTGSEPNCWSIAVRYKIVSDASLTIDGGFAYFAGLEEGNPKTCWCFGSNVVDGDLFAVCYLYNGIFDSAPGAYLLKLPLSYGTTVVEAAAGSWAPQRTSIESQLSFSYLDAPIYFNACAILPYPTTNTVMIVTYRSASTLPGSGSTLTTAGSEFLLVNHVAQSIGTLQSLQGELGQPWSDVGLGFSGTTTPNNYLNDYSGPSFNVDDSRLIFGRVYQDETTANHFREFLYDAALGTFTESVTYDITISGAGEQADDRAVIGWFDGDDLLAGRYSTSQWMVGELAVTPVPPPVVSGGTPYFIERMDNRIWPVIEDAWCVDSALRYPMPEPDATLYVSSATGDQEISEYNLINGGSGYTSPTIQVTDLNPNGGTGATAIATVSSGVITTVAAFGLGSGYINPVATVLDTTGVGAVVQPILTNLVALTTNTSSLTASDVGSIIRVGGGKLEITTVSTVTTAIANIIVPITKTVPNDPNNTPVPAVSGTWSMTVPTTTVSGLAHLAGLTVAALADGGAVTGLVVDDDGVVTLPVEATAITVGLPFVAQLQTMYMDLGGGPTVQTRRKDVTQVVVRVDSSRAPEVGLNQPDAAAQPNQAEIVWGVYPLTGMTQIQFRTPDVPAGQPVPLVSQDLPITNLFSNWDAKGQIAIQQRDPVPLGVTGLISWIKVGDSTGQ